jgi:arylsulfatase A-like enzyme
MDPHTPYLPSTVPGEPELQRRDLFQPQQLLRGEVDFTEANVARLRRQYQGEIRELDSELERLVAGLETMGRLENTLLVITSDHGEESNEHGGLAHGSTLFEEVLRVPMILWAKTGTPAYHSDLAFHQVDFAPTMLEALGVPLPEDMDGLSRWQGLLDENFESPKKLLFHLDLGDARFVALSQEPRKLVCNLEERRFDSDQAEPTYTVKEQLEALGYLGGN